jgi:hypothetical protein
VKNGGIFNEDRFGRGANTARIQLDGSKHPRDCPAKRRIEICGPQIVIGHGFRRAAAVYPERQARCFCGDDSVSNAAASPENPLRMPRFVQAFFTDEIANAGPRTYVRLSSNPADS